MSEERCHARGYVGFKGKTCNFVGWDFLFLTCKYHSSTKCKVASSTREIQGHVLWEVPGGRDSIPPRGWEIGVSGWLSR